MAEGRRKKSGRGKRWGRVEVCEWLWQNGEAKEGMIVGQGKGEGKTFS